jgi:hypothetical protein
MSGPEREKSLIHPGKRVAGGHASLAGEYEVNGEMIEAITRLQI